MALGSHACNMALEAGDSRCHITRCGDGHVNAAAGEQCDTGGADSVTCNGKTCQTPSCGDGYVNAAAGEGCDTGGTIDTVECNMALGAGASRCRAARCGDGYSNTAVGEQCDDGGVDTAACNANCHVANCGDGYVNRMAGEDCDMGGSSTAACNANCTVARCGDGIPNYAAGEQCDTGGVDAAGCIGATCRLSRCGDGVDDDGEICDDGNTSCGSCNSTCTAVMAGPATGTIFPVAGSLLTDGEIFRIGDGVTLPTIFELDRDGSHDPGHVAVPYASGDSAATVASSIITAVNSAGTLSVRASGPFVSPDWSLFVSLANTRLGAVGNHAIVENVASVDFTVSGMTGGGGYDCATGQACRNNQDCQSGECLANTCL